MNVAAPPVNVLSLCSGGGGLDLGVRLALPDARTVCYVENEVTAAAVLVKNMEAGGLDDAPLWTDLRSFDGAAWRGLVDIVIGGYPCQPFSNAGKRLGAADPRHLWPAVAAIVESVQPRWCFFENVGTHLRLGFREVAQDLHRMGYEVAATLLTAEEVGAPHRRERLFILAHRGCLAGWQGAERSGESAREQGAYRAGQRGPSMADTARGVRQRQTPRRSGHAALSDEELADTERGGGSAEPRLEHPQRAEVAARAGAVGDADGVGRRPESDDSEPPKLTHQTERPMEWPPGPNDAGGWRRVLSVRPDLAPALSPDEEWAVGIRYPLATKAAQSALRSVADGMGARVDIARGDQLHILGNGVVPQQAAAALTLLMREALAQ